MFYGQTIILQYLAVHKIYREKDKYLCIQFMLWNRNYLKEIELVYPSRLVPLRRYSHCIRNDFQRVPICPYSLRYDLINENKNKKIRLRVATPSECARNIHEHEHNIIIIPHR